MWLTSWIIIECWNAIAAYLQIVGNRWTVEPIALRPVIDRYGNFHLTDTDTDILILTNADTDTDKKKMNSPIPIRRKGIHTDTDAGTDMKNY